MYNTILTSIFSLFALLLSHSAFADDDNICTENLLQCEKIPTAVTTACRQNTPTSGIWTYYCK